MTQYLAPGVYPNVTNLSQITSLAASSTGAIVLSANQGPKGVYYGNQVKKVIQLFGTPDQGRANALWAALMMIKAGSPVYINNVTHGDDTSSIVAFTAGHAAVPESLGQIKFSGTTYYFRVTQGATTLFTDSAGTIALAAGTYTDSNSNSYTVVSGGVLSVGTIDTTAQGYVAYQPAIPATQSSATVETPLLDPTAYQFGDGQLFIIYAAGPGAFYANIGVKISNVAADGQTFTIQVYNSSNPNIALESFTVSLYMQTTPGGVQTFIEQVINNQSQYIRAMVNPELTGLMSGTVSYGQSGATLTGYVVDPNPNDAPITPAQWTGIIQTITPTVSSLIYLSGGTLGSLPTNADIINGWQVFLSTRQYNANILLNGGYSTPEIQLAMLSVASTRGDAWAVLDAPSNITDPAALVSYRQTQLDYYDRWGSLYAPWVTLYSPYEGMNVSVPASGAVGAVVAYNDFVKDVWWAPAGANRGKVPDAVDLLAHYEQEDMALMYPYSVNNIVNEDGIGIAVWGQRTLLEDDSALWSVNVHRLICVLMKSMASYLKYSEFEQNDETLWTSVVSTLNQFLQQIQNNRGLYKFKVVCDSSNNTGQTIDELILNVDVYLQPTRDAEFIALNGILTQTGATFETTTSSTSPF